MMRWLIKKFLAAYQLGLSPLLKWMATGDPKAPTCRFHPTCSHYCVEAVDTHGCLRGLWLTVRRLVRCHPWGGSGLDPVPARRESSSSNKFSRH